MGGFEVRCAMSGTGMQGESRRAQSGGLVLLVCAVSGWRRAVSVGLERFSAKVLRAVKDRTSGALAKPE